MSDLSELRCFFPLTFARCKPYVNPDMQRLSSVCCVLLVTMSSVLLRSQSLLSSARFINFDPSNPIEAAENQSVDVNFTIVILVGCIFVPFAVALKLHHILQTCFTLLKNRWTQRNKPTHSSNPQNGTVVPSFALSLQHPNFEAGSFTHIIDSTRPSRFIPSSDLLTPWNVVNLTMESSSSSTIARSKSKYSTHFQPVAQLVAPEAGGSTASHVSHGATQSRSPSQRSSPAPPTITVAEVANSTAIPS